MDHNDKFYLIIGIIGIIILATIQIDTSIKQVYLVPNETTPAEPIGITDHINKQSRTINTYTEYDLYKQAAREFEQWTTTKQNIEQATN